MNTITTTASTKAILAIDLGKYKSVACVHDPATGEYCFTTFETTRAELRKLLGKEQPAVVIIEACLLAGWVHDLCGELGVRCLTSLRLHRRLSSAAAAATGSYEIPETDTAAAGC